MRIRDREEIRGEERKERVRKGGRGRRGEEGEERKGSKSIADDQVRHNKQGLIVVRSRA